MNKKVLRKVRRVISLVLVALFLVNASYLDVTAAESEPEVIEYMEAEVREMTAEELAEILNTKTALSGCTISITRQTTGMQIQIYTATTQLAPVIGVKDIKVEQKVWYGWKTVATGNGGELYDTAGMTCTVTFTGAEVGENYRVSCVHYADLDYDGVTQYTELTNNTGEFTYN